MPTSAPQQFTFQAEIQQLLHILSHSLYQNREIALRELVSNASDALNKLRHIQLTEEQYRDDVPLEITLRADKDAKTLTIQDNGLGLTHDELVANLGTVGMFALAGCSKDSTPESPFASRQQMLRINGSTTVNLPAAEAAE